MQSSLAEMINGEKNNWQQSMAVSNNNLLISQIDDWLMAKSVLFFLITADKLQLSLLVIDLHVF